MSNALTALFAADLNLNPVSPWVQIPLALFAAYIFFSLYLCRFGFKIFKRGEEPRFFVRKPVPWGLDVAFALFIVYAIVMPFFVGMSSNLVQARFFPQTEEAAPNVEDDLAESIPIVREGEPTENPTEQAPEAESEDRSEQETSDADRTPDADGQAPDAAEESADQSPNEVSENTSEQEPIGDADQIDDGSKDKKDLSTQHPIARLLIRSKDKPYFWLVLFVFVMAAVIVAPLTEEFIFRVILQGVCDRIAFGRAFNRAMAQAEAEGADSAAQKPVAMGASGLLLTILPPALLFALMHFALPEDPNHPVEIAKLLRTTIVSIFANLITLVVCVSFLKNVSHAAAQDLGFGAYRETAGEKAARFVKEFCRGAVLFLYAMPVVYLVKVALQAALPSYIVDPAPIFVFALWEGVVYYRTRSYPTVVGMHVGLNLTSLLLLCMTLG